MPSPLLNNHSVTTFINGVAFPEGAIFDSHLWATPPYPVQTNDSLDSGIQHMLVVCTFSFTETSAPPSAITLAQYTFDGSGGGTNTASQQQSGVAASAFTTGDGSFSYLAGETGGYAIRDTGWSSDLFSHYFSFTISVASGYHALPSALEFNMQRGNTGLTRWAVRSSVDGFSSDLSNGEQPIADTWSTSIVSFGLDLISGDVTFRIYACDAENSLGNSPKPMPNSRI